MKKLSVPITRTEGILGLCYLVFQLTILPFVISFVCVLLDVPLSEAELNFAIFALEFICVTAIFHRFLIDNAKIALASPRLCLKEAGVGLVIYWLGSYIVGIVIMLLYPDFTNVNDASIAELTQENFSLMAIATVVLAPITEETLFRGLVFGGLYNRSRITAYAVSVLSFSALHVVGYIGLYEPLHLLLCFLQYIPAAISLCWAYVRADSLWAPILMHMTINQIAVFFMR